jgi:hypothetical protein
MEVGEGSLPLEIVLAGFQNTRQPLCGGRVVEAATADTRVDLQVERQTLVDPLGAGPVTFQPVC